MAYIGNPIYQSAFVTDQFSGDGTTTAFTMSVAPAGVSNVLVVVSGVVQDPSTYGVVGTTLNFTSAPPSGTGNISCRYLGVPVTGVTTTAYRTVTEFTATASQTTFTPPSYTVGFINVYRNGVLLGSADYTASNGTTVVLATGATVGDLVTVESFQVSSVVNAIQNTAGSVSSNNLATDSVTTTKIADANVTVAKLAATTGSGNVVLSAAPTLTGQATIPTINLTGGQITFPATQVPSADANTLDDYEEGTWTPTISRTGSSYTFSDQGGTYTKVGRQVTLNGYIRVTGITTQGSSYIRINGIPFASTSISTGAVAYNTIASSKVINAVGVFNPESSLYVFESIRKEDPMIDTVVSGYLMFSLTYFTS